MIRNVRGIVAIFIFAFPIISSAQSSADALLLKVDPEIIAKVKIGTPQQVLVTLDQSDIQASLQSRRLQLAESNAATNSSAANNENTEKIIAEESSKQLQAAKDQLFPQGRRGTISVFYSFSHLPIVAVTVTDIDSLMELLAEPRVIRVEQMPKAVPLGSADGSNLQLIGQPAAVSANQTGQGTRLR